MYCLNCKQKITSKYAKKFCSRSCSQTYNNKLPGRKRMQKTTRTCKTCGKEYFYNHRINCDDCIKRRKNVGELTLNDIYQKKNYHQYIRAHANRVWRDANKPFSCTKCGFCMSMGKMKFNCMCTGSKDMVGRFNYFDVVYKYSSDEHTRTYRSVPHRERELVDIVKRGSCR